ncbi:MAG: hypothetical protein ACMUHB_05925, partial [Thermoplasmatota archaeon]
PGLMVDESSFSHAYWIDHSTPGGDIYSSMNQEGPLEESWTLPLRLTDDPDLEMAPLLVSLENGLFLLSFNRVGRLPFQGNGGTGPFKTVNLSWGAEVISIDLDPEKDISAGEMVKATVLVESNSLHPEGIVRVDLYRRVRDRDTGGIMDEPWESRVVEFTRARQRGQASFTVPVKEFQLGLVARTSPPLEGIPAQSSSRFVSLPALPDPEITGLEILDPADPGPNITAVVHLRNWGIVSVGKWDIEIRSSPPSPPMHFRGKVQEPVHFRSRETYEVLNTTKIDIDEGAQTTVEINISLSPGVNNIWAVVRGPKWLPEGESTSALSLVSMPETELTSTAGSRSILLGDRIEMELDVRNIGIWPLNISLDEEGIEAVQDLVPELPLRWLWVDVTDGSGNLLFSNISFIDDLGPEEVRRYYWSMDPVVGVLSYHVRAGLSEDDASHNGSHPLLTFRVDVLVEPQVQITGIDDEWSSTNLGKGLKVGLKNPSNTTAWIVHLILYNGYPADGVIVSEALAMEIGPNGSREVLLPLQLEEGRYILAVTASCAAPPVGSSTSIWRDPTVEVTDMSIEPPPDPQNGDNGEVNMDEVTSSLIISIAASMFVLMVSSIFFKRQQEES